MKINRNLPPTSTQIILTAQQLEQTRKFHKAHWQCNQAKQCRIEFITVPKGAELIISCNYCTKLPKNKISLQFKEVEGLLDFADSHNCNKGEKAFGLISSDCSIGDTISVYCCHCGETKELNDVADW